MFDFRKSQEETGRPFQSAKARYRDEINDAWYDIYDSYDWEDFDDESILSFPSSLASEDSQSLEGFEFD